MKTKFIIGLISLFVIPLVSFGQEDIRREILNYEDSKHYVLDKGRRLLTETLQEGDFIKAKEVKNFLLEDNAQNIFEIFYPIEYIHLLYLTEEFNELTDFMKQVDFETPVSYSVRVLAPLDNLFKTLREKNAMNKDVTEISIRNSSLNEVDKDFLILQLNDILRTYTEQGTIDVESEETQRINQMANDFLTKHPDSDYVKLVRETIRFEFRESKWAQYFDVGIGAILHRGELNDYLNDGFYLEISYEARYNRFIGALGAGFSAQSLTKDIEINNTVWENGKHATIGNIFLNGGYEVLSTPKWSVYPFFGIGYQEFSAAENDSEENPQLKNMKLNSVFTQAGIGIDFKYRTSGNNFSTDIPGRLSLRYSYRMPKYEQKITHMDGFQHCITLSWGMGGRKKVRDF